MNEKACRAEDCGRSLKRANVTGYCAKHAGTAKKCAVEGCTNRVSAYNKRGACREHYGLVDNR